MKYFKLVLLCLMPAILIGCGTSLNNNGDDKQMEDKLFEKTFDNQLNYKVEVNKKNDKLKVKATVTNNTHKDYTFGGNPCNGQLTIGLWLDNEKIQGEGKIVPDACIEPYVEHTIKSGETITAVATYDLDKLDKNTYKISSYYDSIVFENNIEIK